MLCLADWGALNASSLSEKPSSQFPIRHPMSVTFGMSVGNLSPGIEKTISSHLGHLNRESVFLSRLRLLETQQCLYQCFPVRFEG